VRCAPARRETVAPASESSRVGVYLHAGQLAAPERPAAITTILGSCVAVCLWDSALRQGGMNHFLLPYWSGNGSASARFGNVAVDALIESLGRIGSRKGSLQAKLFGGACVIRAFTSGERLGVKNVQLARKLLAGHGVPVVAEDVLGRRGRKLVFHTDDGAAWVKDL
jgi:chemotaxis protein CheD